ncbi:S8 family peptidase [Vacuolonema iberomarrocanum]|uniref:S8 family peptidase n=1 Tax=Vacuolonema iberomarrocanum TaxID=3454632 RepID=UPI001A01C09B|nr:S8 family serine peptidase [filamentous cyanobacterium LEGE 07170]
MSLNKYVVLRHQSIIVPTIDNLGTLTRASSFALASEAVEITEAELTLKERSDLRRDPRVRAIAPPMPLKLVNPIEKKDVDPPSPASPAWGVQAVRATETPYDGTNITVAVLDTGIEPDHPAFGSIDLVQKNFTSEGENDTEGHGTHCAGTIFGHDVDGTRIGIARGVRRALIGKVLGEGAGSSATIAQAIQWAVNEGANVISMSLGIDFPGFVDLMVNTYQYDINLATSMALEAYRANINLFSELAQFVEAQGIFGDGTIIIAASGNESNRPDYEIAVAPPAAGTGVIAVGALEETDSGLKEAYFSNSQVDVSAPGVGIVSAKLGGGLTSMSGTSMATPHVAGVAALWAQRQRDLTGRVENRSLLAQLIASGTTVSLIPKIEEEDVGTGIVQAPLS